MTEEQIIEVVARTICCEEGYDPDFVPSINPTGKREKQVVDDCARPYWTNYRDHARAVLEALIAMGTELTPFVLWPSIRAALTVALKARKEKRDG